MELILEIIYYLVSSVIKEIFLLFGDNLMRKHWCKPIWLNCELWHSGTEGFLSPKVLQVNEKLQLTFLQDFSRTLKLREKNSWVSLSVVTKEKQKRQFEQVVCPKTYPRLVFGWKSRLRHLQTQSWHKPANHAVKRKANALNALLYKCFLSTC